MCVRVCNLLQLCKSSAVVAPFRGVLQVLIESVGQRSERWIQILHRQLGATQRRRRRRKDVEVSPGLHVLGKDWLLHLHFTVFCRSIFAALKQGLWEKHSHLLALKEIK